MRGMFLYELYVVSLYLLKKDEEANKVGNKPKSK
jgi:hypothetical protein